ncbi:hypothetical protein EX895_005886 [Sporisorium graminicola]|uniref:Mig1 protein n=1 Tax=Sporisorium graminicola TaxID=280036 RepID=A0A4U7KLW0_9BASI|nr:hypothetical protein EX895_005886 [Sporisorium graminicola]TKY84806.1 hypothetical protein EX895_005886 [Sporisorium graminicola]
MAGRTLSVKYGLAAAAAVAIASLLPVTQSTNFPKWNGIGPQVTPELTRSLTEPAGHLLRQDLQDPCYFITPLVVDPDGYNDRCSPPLNGPCFELVGASMKGVSVEPWYEPDNITDILVLAADSATAFAMKDPSVAFEVDFHAYGDSKFRYLNYDPVTNCYDVVLERKKDTLRHKRWRISVGETENDRDLDTLNRHYTTTRFCAEKLVINIRRQPKKRS